jgi:hypothetical protein
LIEGTVIVFFLLLFLFWHYLGFTYHCFSICLRRRRLY